MPQFTLEFSEDDPLFCAAFHPTAPEFVLGFASGRVSCYEYAASGPENSSDSEGNAPGNAPATNPKQRWTTKRHKGSCRALKYSLSGEFVVSAGQDAVAKRFAAATGRVTHKTDLPAGATSLAVNEAYIVIGDEEGGVHAYTHELAPHRSFRLAGIDSITAVCALEHANKHNFAVSGESRIVRIDVRRAEPVTTSEDQEDEILCGCVASEKWSAWGMSEGVLTVWNNRGLMDQQTRVVLTKDGSVESVIAAEEDNRVVAGTSDGLVSEIDVTSGRILFQAQHNPADSTEEVAYLDFDCEWRLVTMSMSRLKLWLPSELEEASQARRRQQQEQKQAPKKKRRKTASSGPAKPAAPTGFEDLL